MTKGTIDRRRKLEFKVLENGCFECVSHKARRIHEGDANHWSTLYWFEGRSWLLHRWIYTQMFGEIPEGMVIRHKCHSGFCINPEHLELGTQFENMQDMIQGGRNRCGPRIINEQIAQEVRDLALDGRFKQREIGQMYGISPQVVSDIKQNRLWKPEHLERRNSQSKGEFQCQS